MSDEPNLTPEGVFTPDAEVAPAYSPTTRAAWVSHRATLDAAMRMLRLVYDSRVVGPWEARKVRVASSRETHRWERMVMDESGGSVIAHVEASRPSVSTNGVRLWTVEWSAGTATGSVRAVRIASLRREMARAASLADRYLIERHEHRLVEPVCRNPNARMT